MKDKIIGGICFLVNKLVKDPLNHINMPDWQKPSKEAFDDKHSPDVLRENMRSLGINPIHTDYIVSLYETTVYDKIIKQIDENNDYKYRTE